MSKFKKSYIDDYLNNSYEIRGEQFQNRVTKLNREKCGSDLNQLIFKYLIPSYNI